MIDACTWPFLKIWALDNAFTAHVAPVALCFAMNTLPKLPVPSTLPTSKSLSLHAPRGSCNQTHHQLGWTLIQEKKCRAEWRLCNTIFDVEYYLPKLKHIFFCDMCRYQCILCGHSLCILAQCPQQDSTEPTCFWSFTNSHLSLPQYLGRNMHFKVVCHSREQFLAFRMNHTFKALMLHCFVPLMQHTVSFQIVHLWWASLALQHWDWGMLSCINYSKISPSTQHIQRLRFAECLMSFC